MKADKILEKHPEVVVAYLFGSTARGEADKYSDVDIGVLLKDDFKPDRFYEAKLAREIEENTGMKNVEVTILNKKPVSFLNQVLRYGKILFCSDEIARIRFETNVTRKYIDLKPYFEEYERMRRFS